MPTYEYVCTACGEPLEVVASIHAPAETECPACGGRLRKVFGNVGVVFKGSGFYRTDSRSTKGKKPAAAGAKEKVDAGSSSGSNGSDGASATSKSTPTSTGSGSGASPAAPASTSTVPASA